MRCDGCRRLMVLWFAGICAFGSAEIDVRPAVAEDFSVENRVYVEGQKAPASQSTTIFLDGVVYDYLEGPNDPPEVVVFDQTRDLFVLIDTARKVRAELTTDEVAGFCERIQQTAAKRDDPFLKFLAAPKFLQNYDEETATLSLSSVWMTYRLTLLSPVGKSISVQYREFSDGYARLNSLLNPAARPPMARLLVNAALSRYSSIPSEVELSIMTAVAPPKRTTIRSSHRLSEQLSQPDRARVANTRRTMTSYKLVSFQKYRGAGN